MKAFYSLGLIRLVLVFVFLFLSASIAQAQVNATLARHENDNQNQITIRLDANLAALYNTTTGWSVTVGGAPVAIVSVLGAGGTNTLTLTLVDPNPPAGVATNPDAIGIGQAVVVNFAGDAAVNAIVNMASQNNRAIVCSDINFVGLTDSSLPCAPVEPKTSMTFSVKPAARNSSAWSIANMNSTVYWRTQFAAPFSFIAPFESTSAGAAAASTYFITYHSDNDASNFIYPGTETVCGYTSFWMVRIASIVGACPITNPNQSVVYASFNTDAAGEGDGQLISQPTIANTDQVCEGQFVNMSFSDVSDLNCIDEAASPPPLPNNTFDRWVRVIYGFPHTAGGTIRNVHVGGVQITDANGDLLPAYAGTGYVPVVPNALGTPDAFGVVNFPATVTPPNNDLETITTSTATLEGDAGRTFNITLQYWNVCNSYTTGDFSNAREITDQVIVINAPVAPGYTPNPAVICNNQSDASYLLTAAGTGGTYQWYRDAGLTDLEKTGTTFNPVTEGTPAVNKTTAGVYTYYLTETLGNGCTSPPTTVTMTIRNALGTPPAFTGSTDVCPSTTYTWTVPVAPAVEPFGGATEYVWTYPGTWTFVSQTATSITLTTSGTPGANTLSVRRRYTSTPNCQSNARNGTITIRANPTASITPDPVNICQGSSLQINGNPTNPFGTIASHLWTGNTGILDDPNIQQPTISAATAPGVYNLTYTVTNSIGCSGSDNVVVTVSANPTLASAGADQPLCQALLTSNPIGASDPAPGTGTWTVVSQPGGSNVTFDGGVNNRNTTITVDQNGAYTLRWTVVNGACTSFDDVVIDFGTDPGVQNAGADNAFCGLNGSLNAVAPTVGTIAWTQFSGPGATTFSATNINNPTISVTVAGTYVYRMTVTSGTCAPRIDDVQIVFNTPATSSPAADFTSCVDPGVLAPINLTGTVGGGATGGRWERVSGSGTIGSSGTNIGNNILGVNVNDTYTPTAADFATGSFQVRLVATGAAAPCPEVSTTRTITIDRRPTVVDAGPDQPLVCADPVTSLGSTTLAALAVNNGGSGAWSGPGGVTFGNAASPTSTVSNLPIGTTTLTWTVSSAAGVCGNQTNTVDITVNALPAANNPAPNNLCESAEGSGIANGTNLTQYHDGITGIAGSTNRTVTWYTAATRLVGDQIIAPTSFNVSNGLTLFTRVTNTITNCFRDGVVTFTVNPLPAASDHTFEFCEEFPAGSNQVNNIDLTTNAMINPITGGVANRSVTWFNTQLGAINNNAGDLIATPAAFDIVGNTIIYARVVNTLTTCVNIAEATLLVKPRPADPTIFGSTNQCVGNFDLYNITPVGGATYIWDVDDNPATEFSVISGGGVNDFLVVVEFPNVYTGDIRVTVDLNGCQSNQVTKTVTVDATPPAVTITASKDPVCENEAGIVYTATALPNTDYTWFLPGTTGAIIGGQGSNQVTVNLGALSGNIEVTPQTQGGSCAGAPATFFIDVRERPVLSNALNTTVCSDDPINVVFAVAGGSVPATSYLITNVTVPPGLSPSSRSVTNPVTDTEIQNDVYTNTTGGNLTVRYTVVPVSAEGCQGSPVDIFVTIQPEPTLDPNLGKAVCSREATGIVLKVATGSIAADQYEIVSINPNGLVSAAGNPQVGGGIFGPSEIVDDSWINTTGAPVVVTYNIRPINSGTGCIGDPPLAVMVTINPEPVVVAFTETICSGDIPTTILSTTNLPGSTFTYTVKSITGLITGANNGTGNTINNLLVNNGAGAGSVTYEVIATGPAGSGSCQGQPQDVIINVNPSPTANDIVQTVCSDVAGANTITRDLTLFEPTINNTGTVTFTWYQDLGMTIQITGGALNAYVITNNIPVYVLVDNGQCSKLASVTFTINPLPAITAIAPQFNGFEINCNGASNGQINASANSGTAPYIFSINGGGTYFPSGTFNALAPNTYTIRVRDSKGCEVDSSPIIIAEPTPVLATPGTVTNALCKGSATGSIQIVGSGGVGGYTYSINGGAFQASDTFTGLTAGTFTIAVRDANGCTDTEFVTVTEPNQLTGSITAQTNVDCNGNSTGSVTVAGAGGFGAFEYSLNGGPFQVSGTFNGLAAATYTVTVRDANLCTTNVAVVITQPAVLTLALSSKDDVDCNGGSDGSLTVSGSGGTTPYMYDIGGGFQVSGTFTGLAANTYTVTVRDNQNCQTTLNIVITEPTLLTGSITSQTNVNCFGNATGSVTVNGSGGTGTYQFSLNGGAFQASGTFNGLTAGPYTVTVRDQNLCTFNVPVTITEPTLLTGNVDNVTDALCFGGASGTVTVSGSGGTSPYTFSINGGGLFVGSGTFTGLAAGNYTIIVRDNNLCTTNVPFTIGEPTALSGSTQAVTNVDCRGNATGSITVMGAGGTGAYEYSINGGAFQVSNIFSSLIAGSYTIRVRDANLCTFDFNQVVTEPTLLTIALVSQTNVDCNGNSTGSITVAGSGGPVGGGYQYSLVSQGNPPGVFGASATFPGLVGGGYTIYVRDANACQSQIDATITEPNVLLLTLVNKVDVVCNGQSTGSITVQASQGTSPYEYSINGSAFTPNNTFSFLTANTYTIVVQDFNGCQETIVEAISQPAALTGSLTATSDYNGFDVSCFNQNDGQITVTTVGGTGPFGYLLLQDPSNNTGTASGVFDNVRAGNYSVRITDGNACSFITPAIPVTQPNDLNIQIAKTANYNSFDVSCFGASDGEISVTTMTGGAGGYTYELSLVTNTTGDASGVYTGLPSGLYTITVTDINTCQKESLPVVLLDPLPMFEGIIGFDEAICVGEDPVAFAQIAPAFGGIGNYTYQWQESTDNISFANVGGATASTYNPPAIAQTRFYKRLVTSGTCVTMESNVVKVTVNPLPTGSFTPSKSPVCEGDFFLLDFAFTGTSPYTFRYSDGTTTFTRIGVDNTPVPVINYTNQTTYTLIDVTDYNGCQTTINQVVTVPIIEIDNTFTVIGPDALCSGGTFEFQWQVDADVRYTWFLGGDQVVIGPNDPLFPPGIRSLTTTRNEISTSGTLTIPIILQAESTVLAGCSALPKSDEVYVFPSVLENIIPGDTIICHNQSVEFKNNTIGASSHLWEYRIKGSGASPTQLTSKDVTIQFPNTSTTNPLVYEVYYRGSNLNTCFDERYFDVVVYRGLTADFSFTPANPTFSGGMSNVQFTNTSSVQDDGIFRYEWNFGANATPATQTGAGPVYNVTYLSPGFKTVTLEITNLQAEADGEACSTTRSRLVEILVPAFNAAFTVTPMNSCYPTDLVTENTSGAADTFMWWLINQQNDTVGISNLVNPTFKVFDPGVYRLVLRAELVATNQVEIEIVSDIRVYDKPVALYLNFPGIGITEEPVSFADQSVSPIDPITTQVYPLNYFWNFGDDSPIDNSQNPTHTYELEGLYPVTLTVTNEHIISPTETLVCADSITKEFPVKQGGNIKVPNAFFPSTSGPVSGNPDDNPDNNFVFLPVMRGVDEFKMQIFDRWGNLVFESKDKNFGWNGYDRNGNLLPMGVYVYKLVLRLVDGQRTTKVGDVTLIR